MRRKYKMLKGIEFTDKRFKTENDYNVLGELTENTIILCNNYKLMDSLAKEILDTIIRLAKTK